MLVTADDLIRAAKKEVAEITAPELAAKLEAGKDIVLIDVRESDEYRAGHLPGASNIPRGVLEFQVAAHPALAGEPTAPELARHERPICLYCRSGGRAILAAYSLQKMGFTAVMSLAGGYLDWSAHELKTET